MESLISNTPFNFEFRFEKSFFIGTSCKIYYEGREPYKSNHVDDSNYQAIHTAFKLARDFEDMICSLSTQEMEYMDSMLFYQLSTVFNQFYTKYPLNFVNTNSRVNLLTHEHLRDYKIGENVVHGCPRSISLVGTVLTIAFCPGYYEDPDICIKVQVPTSFDKMIKIGKAANILSDIRVGHLDGLFNFYVSAGWRQILSDVYSHPCHVPEKIKYKIPKDSSFWRK